MSPVLESDKEKHSTENNKCKYATQCKTQASYYKSLQYLSLVGYNHGYYLSLRLLVREDDGCWVFEHDAF